MIVSLIVACAENGVIGKDNDLVWDLPDDMRFFMNTTRGHHIIMGRKNWFSIPEKYRPLKDRVNIVLSRDPEFSIDAPDTLVMNDLSTAIRYSEQEGERELFIIGGAQIYELSLPFVQRMYITEVHGSPAGDAWFPEWNKEEWKEVSRTFHGKDKRHEFTFDFVVYERVQAVFR